MGILDIHNVTELIVGQFALGSKDHLAGNNKMGRADKLAGADDNYWTDYRGIMAAEWILFGAGRPLGMVNSGKSRDWSG